MTDTHTSADAKLDAFIEVGRMAYELRASHGCNAHKYAAKLAAAALAEGAAKEHDFWKRVEGSLTPRTTEINTTQPA
jgi:hypothetical protein